MTLAQLVIARAGFWKAATILLPTIAQWAVAMRHYGERPITVSQYAEFMKISERTAYRHLAQVREAIPEVDLNTLIEGLVYPKMVHLDEADVYADVHAATVPAELVAA